MPGSGCPARLVQLATQGSCNCTVLRPHKSLFKSGLDAEKILDETLKRKPLNVNAPTAIPYRRPSDQVCSFPRPIVWREGLGPHHFGCGSLRRATAGRYGGDRREGGKAQGWR